MSDTVNHLKYRSVLIGVVGGVALVGVFLGARALGHALSDSEADPADSVAVVASTTTTVEAPVSTSLPSTTSTTVPPSSGNGSSEIEPEVVVGEPVITPTVPVEFSDQARVLPDEVPTGMVFSAPSSSGSNPFETQLPPTAHIQAGPNRPFGMGVEVETDGHFATFIVGISSGPEGLDGLTVDFGDGSAPYEMPQSELNRFGDQGTVEVTHRFEPSVQPREWPFVVVEVIDGSGEVVRSTPKVITQGKVNLIYSPLTVTALGDCDLFGTSEFRLRWNNDGRDRKSEFKLRKGESHVEEDFRVRIGGVTSGSEPELRMAISERDPGIVGFLKLISYQDHLAAQWTTLLNLVLDGESHLFHVSLVLDAADCDVQATYSMTISPDEEFVG